MFGIAYRINYICLYLKNIEKKSYFGNLFKKFCKKDFY